LITSSIFFELALRPLEHVFHKKNSFLSLYQHTTSSLQKGSKLQETSEAAVFDFLLTPKDSAKDCATESSEARTCFLVNLNEIHRLKG